MSAPCGCCGVTIVAVHPPRRPNTNPKAGARIKSNAPAKTKNTTLESDHVAVTPAVTAKTALPTSAPMKPARRPAALGSDERIVAMNPAMNAPRIIIPPPISASPIRSGSQLSTATTGREAIAPISANFHDGGRVRRDDDDAIRLSMTYLIIKFGAVYSLCIHNALLTRVSFRKYFVPIVVLWGIL